MLGETFLFMINQKNSSIHLRGLVISIKTIRCDGELDGYSVRVTRPDQSVKYIYRFPADRASVLNVVLTQIGNLDSENLTSGRR